MGLARIGAALAAVPVGLALGVVHRMATGRDAVLDVTIDRVADLKARDALLRRLRRAADDPNVAALVLRFKAPPAGWAACQDLRGVIVALRSAGKPVYAWLEHSGNATTWLASACDKVFLVPTGEVGLVGVGTELTFFGAALGRLGVQPDFEAAGEYKSFGEPWTRTFPSPENHEAIRDLVDDLHDQLVTGIAEGRSRPVDEVRAILGRAPLSAEDALAGGLVDQLLYEDQLLPWLREHHGRRAHLVPFQWWSYRDALLARVASWGVAGSSVVVLHLQGPIVLEDRSGTAITARRVGPLIQRLRDDDDVAAVVLHVDSPGGSALASDLIWREVDALKRRKPVVASFEDVSASGGFYLSAPANTILVRPGTLTGSIGVFGGKLVLQEGLRKVGVHTQEILGAPNANLYSASHRFTPDQRERFKASLGRFYTGFVTRVAAGRGKDAEAIEPHCRGRVWSGRAAKDRGLVDEAGNLDVAVQRARTLAGLPERFVRHDVSGHSDPIFTRLLQSAIKHALPATMLRWTRLAERLLPPGVWMVEVAAAHQGEALAMLDVDVTLR